MTDVEEECGSTVAKNGLGPRECQKLNEERLYGRSVDGRAIVLWAGGRRRRRPGDVVVIIVDCVYI